MDHVIKELGISERRARRVLGQYRSAQRKVPTTPDDEAAPVADIIELVLDSGARKTVVAKLGRHQVIGEMALLLSMARTASIQASSPLTMLALSQDIFIRLVQENADIAVGMARVLAERLAATLRDLSRVSAQVASDSESLKSDT